MNLESLEDLMMLDALGETTAEQQARLREALASDAALAERHASLLQEVRQLESTMGTSQNRLASQEPAPIPAHVLTQLEATRREALTQKSVQQAAAPNVVVFSPRAKGMGPELVERPESQISNRKSTLRPPPSAIPTWLSRAAILALLAGITGYWFLQKPGLPPIASAALAPRGETGLTQPLLVWENKPDQKYDVWILPPEGGQLEAPALFTAKNVRSPLAFTDLKPAESQKGKKELEPGKPYRLLVCFATLGRLSGVTVPFQTSADAEGQIRVPPDGPAMLLKAKRLIESNKPGDALMVLTSLPETERSKPEVTALEEQARKMLPAPAGPPRG